MVTMRLLLSEIDVLAVLERTPARIGETVYPPGGSYGPAWQRNLELVLVYTGSARVSVDGEPLLHIPPGWVALRLPHRLEHYAFDDSVPTHHSWVELYVESWPTSLLDRFSALPPLVPISSALTTLISDGIAVTRTPWSTAEPLIASLAAAAVWRYVAEAESNTRGGDDIVERARHFIHSHVEDPEIDLQQIAAAAHVSPPHLVRCFRRDLGVTPIAYLWQRRVAVGIDLLISTGLPVGDIATRAGFSSVYHFSRRVKAQTGLPPTKVRQERWSRSGDDAPDPAPAGRLSSVR
jgi:AraC-like DNA-binding protein